MKEYIKAMRLPACLFAGLITFASFKLADSIAGSILPTLATILIFVATMVQNDLRDCQNDRKKGKTFPYDHRQEFRVFAIALWIIANGTGIALAWQNPYYLVVAFTAILIGFVYSELQRVPFLSNGLVALGTASVAAYPICDGKGSMVLWALVSTMMLMIMVGMYSREILKDFDDKQIDQGHKWTLLQRYGEMRAWRLAVYLAVFLLIWTEPLTIIPLFKKKLHFIPIRGLLKNCPTQELTSETKLRLDIGLVIILLLFILL